jgi:hypothetical protein
LFVGILIFLLFFSFALGGNISVDGKADTDRCNYILFFHVTDYDPKLADAVEYFFKKVLKPEDQLTLLSLERPYSYTQKTRQTVPLEKLIEVTNKKLKTDTPIGALGHNQVFEEMVGIIRDIHGILNPSASKGGAITDPMTELKILMGRYRKLRESLRNTRKLNESLLIKLAGLFKNLKGQNYIYIFYQKEFQAIPDRNSMNRLTQIANIRFDVMELFRQENTEAFIDVEKVDKALKESAVTLDLFYLNMKNKRQPHMELKEFSGDIYNVLSKLAKSTGGIIVATAKPEEALKKALNAQQK